MPGHIIRRRTWLIWWLALVVTLAQPAWGYGLARAHPAKPLSVSGDVRTREHLPKTKLARSSALPDWFEIINTAVDPSISTPSAPLPDRFSRNVQPQRPPFSPVLSKASSVVTATLGQVFTYTLVFTIPAGVDITDVALTDQLPLSDPDINVVANSAIGPIPITGPPIATAVSYNSSNLSWDFLDDISNPGPGDYVYIATYQARVDTSTRRNHGGDVGTNQAVLSWNGDSTNASATVTIVAPSLQFKRIAYTADGERAELFSPDEDLLDLRSGELITITTIVTNAAVSWVSPAFNVLIHDELPAWVDYVGLLSGPVPTVIAGDTYLQWLATTRSGGTVASLDALSPGEAFRVRYLARVVDGVAPGQSSFPDTQAKYTYQAPVAGFETTSRDHWIQFRTPDIVVVKTFVDRPLDQSSVVAGEFLTYSIAYTLPWGTTLYPPINLNDQLDDGLYFLGVVSQPADAAPPSVNTSQEYDTILQWGVFAASPVPIITDVRHTYVITAQVSPTYFLGSNSGEPIGQGARLSNEATLEWKNERGGNVKYSSERASVWLTRPEFNPIKWKEDPDDRFEGAGVPVRFELRDVRNISSTYGALAYNVIVTDILPPGWTFASAQPASNPPTTLNGQTVVTWGPVPSVPQDTYLPGESSIPSVYVITATPPLTVVAGRPYSNVVQVGYDSAQNVRYVDWDELVMALPPEIFKQASPTRSNFMVGEVITYALSAVVPPTSTFFWSRHLDPLPPGVRYAGWYAVDGGELAANPLIGTSPDAREVITVSWRPLDNSLSSEPLTFTFSFGAVFAGEDTDGLVQWTGYDGRFRVRNDATLEWNTRNVSDTYEFEETVGHQVFVLQPYLVDADWFYTKTVTSAGPDVVGGDLVTYSLSLYNTGRASAYDVVISDQLPSGVEFVNYTAAMFNQWAGETYLPGFQAAPLNGDRGSIGWVVDEINRNHADNSDRPTQFILTYTVRVLDSVGAGADLINSAWISDYSSLPGDQPFERHYGYLDQVGERVSAAAIPVAEPTIGKSTSVSETSLGEQVIFTITVPYIPLGATLYNVVVTDIMPSLPGPIQALAALAPGASSVNVTSDSVSVNYDLIQPNTQATIVITARVPITAVGGLTQNRAVVEWQDAASGGVSHSATSEPASIDISAPDLQVIKSAPGAASPGSPLVYSVTYFNTGRLAARSARLTDTLPISVTYVGSRYDRPVTATGSAPGPLVWDLGDLAPGERGTVWITVTVWSTASLGTDLINIANIGSLTLGDDPTNNEDAAATTISVVVLDLSKRATPDPVSAGDQIVYTLVVTNAGSQATENLLITDQVPLNTTFVSASPDSTLVGDMVAWNPTEIGPGQQAVVTFAVRVGTPLVSGTLITNASYSALADNAPVALGNPVAVTVNSRPVMFVEKTAAATVQPGDNLVYVVRYGNTGNALAHNVQVIETYDPNVTFIAADPAPSVGENIWQVGTLAPSVARTIVITVQVNASIDHGTTLTNTVIVDSDETASTSDSAATVAGIYYTYLPVVLKAFSVPLPPVDINLVVQNIEVIPAVPTVGQPTRIAVTLYNAGVSTVTDDFWVDLYVDPSTTPTANVLWNDIAPYGKAWFIHEDIPGGGMLVIHTDQPDDSLDPDSFYSNWPGWFVAAGERVLYVQVDSFGPGTGLVSEDVETDNVLGPSIVTVLPGR